MVRAIGHAQLIKFFEMHSSLFSVRCVSVLLSSFLPQNLSFILPQIFLLFFPLFILLFYSAVSRNCSESVKYFCVTFNVAASQTEMLYSFFPGFMPLPLSIVKVWILDNFLFLSL